MTDTSVITHPIQYYDRDLLERAKPLLVHEAFGQTRDIPAGNSDIIKFARYERLSKVTDPLDEGVTPSGSSLSRTLLQAQLDWYGDFTPISDKLIKEGFDNIVGEATRVFGQQMGESLDAVVRNKLHTGSNVVYAGDAVSRITVAALDVPTDDDLNDIALLLKNANAMPITEFVRPDEGYATTPVRPSYVGIIHTNSRELYKAMDGFEHAEKYANMGNLLPGELGRVGDFRICEVTEAMVFDGEGAAGVDVYSDLFMGRDAYGVTTMKGENAKLYVKGLGSAGTEDPIDQRASVGWKAPKTARILNDTWIVRYEHTIA